MIYILEPEIFDYFPDQPVVDFALQVFPTLLENDVAFHVHEIDSYWNDVGSLPEYLRGNLDAVEGAVDVELGGSLLDASGGDEAVERGDPGVSGMVLAADMAVCNENARFLCSWHSNGVANDGATSYTLARIVGFRRAMELMLTNRTLGPEEALDWQIVNRFYPNAEFDERVAEAAADLAAGPTHLQAMAKERFHEGWRQSIEECTEYEIQNIMDSIKDPYFLRRIERFVSKEGRNDALIVRLP